MSDKQYTINEIFYSLQGEGRRAGTANVFVRFSGCNLTCSRDDAFSGFDCDTEFTSGVKMTAEQIYERAYELTGGKVTGVVFTGGEPALQLDRELIKTFRSNSPGTTELCIETNGTRNIDDLALDWVTVSPKSAEHTIQQLIASEVKYVRQAGQGIPKTNIKADFYLVSPAFGADGRVNKETLQHCIQLVKENPRWQLSLQLHKFLSIR